jgi:hypothetical protein
MCILFIAFFGSSTVSLFPMVTENGLSDSPRTQQKSFIIECMCGASRQIDWMRCVGDLKITLQRSSKDCSPSGRRLFVVHIRVRVLTAVLKISVLELESSFILIREPNILSIGPCNCRMRASYRLVLKSSLNADRSWLPSVILQNLLFFVIMFVTIPQPLLLGF